MKYLLLTAVLFITVSSARSQDIIFNIDQAGQSLKKEKSSSFIDAELKDINLTIKLKNKTVEVVDQNTIAYQLVNLEQEKKVNMHTYSQFWIGKDEQNNDVKIKFTVNTKSKEALVELDTQASKSYYFGTCASGEKLTRR